VYKKLFALCAIFGLFVSVAFAQTGTKYAIGAYETGISGNILESATTRLIEITNLLKPVQTFSTLACDGEQLIANAQGSFRDASGLKRCEFCETASGTFIEKQYFYEWHASNSQDVPLPNLPKIAGSNITTVSSTTNQSEINITGKVGSTKEQCQTLTFFNNSWKHHPAFAPNPFPSFDAATECTVTNDGQLAFEFVNRPGQAPSLSVVSLLKTGKPAGQPKKLPLPSIGNYTINAMVANWKDTQAEIFVKTLRQTNAGYVSGVDELVYSYPDFNFIKMIQISLEKVTKLAGFESMNSLAISPDGRILLATAYNGKCNKEILTATKIDILTH